MAYDEKLAGRVRKALAGRPGLTESKMFGGLTYMLGGNMCCGIHKDELIVRVGPGHYADALAQPGARPMDITGRPMNGWVFVGPAGWRTEKDLRRWVGQGAEFAQSLPAKNGLKRARSHGGASIRRTYASRSIFVRYTARNQT